MSTQEVIERGEGLPPYRPRKKPFAVVLGDYYYSIVVARTHDLGVADRLAADEWYRTVGDPIRIPEGCRVWAREVPWDPSGEFDRAWITTGPSDRRACAAVWYGPL